MKRLKRTNCWQPMDKYITPLSSPTWKENFKGVLLASRKLLTTKSPLKMMKNTFYFLVKTLFGLLLFCPDFLAMQKNNLMRKLWLITKFITSQTGQKMITIHILPNILRSKGNWAIKFGQLIKHSVRNVLPQKSCKKWGRKTISRTLAF